ncbi:immunity 22 family protein [Catenuloplanes atrovinosus]|uniref:Uncharacterized protein n=1 Tax=Catenuloplanes atrovinosus TaxID=137266 RepID=A0AAE3YJT5_9ACTN|nr:immunity 22 family protein [Catenuloplanes atrovinosus]MDR7275153.1 hypothetical protein [Catenuloplanes atrovinosus]
MAVVHVFVATGRFASEEELWAFVEPAYTTDGDAVSSPFMREIALDGYEPAAIEAVHAASVVPVRHLLREASWAEQWVADLDPALRADAAICVFPPNLIAAPHESSLEYCGALTYGPTQNS